MENPNGHNNEKGSPQADVHSCEGESPRNSNQASLGQSLGSASDSSWAMPVATVEKTETTGSGETEHKIKLDPEEMAAKKLRHWEEKWGKSDSDTASETGKLIAQSLVDYRAKQVPFLKDDEKTLEQLWVD